MNNKGFTLIELMIVVVIIGILAAIAIPNFMSMQDRAKEGSVKANMHTLQLASEDFSTQADGIYAGNLASTIADANALSASVSTIPLLLPGNFKNPFLGTTGVGGGLALNDGGAEPAVFAVADRGIVYYNGLDVAGAYVGAVGPAVSYAIYGAGKTDIIILRLTSGQ
jgi:prepilin-type N-terminal cleavage/methylation domain-containing protein